MQYQITPQFARLLRPNTLESLNNHQGAVYGLDAELKLAYLNPAWFQFAAQNAQGRFDEGVWTLGKDIFDCIPDVLHDFYQGLFASMLAIRQDELISPKEIEYECSSPDLFRKFSMHLYPLGPGGFLTVHSLLVEEAYQPEHGQEYSFEQGEAYIDASGLLLQCPNCRRVKNLMDPDRWDWIPAIIKQPYATTSHGVCPVCANHFYLDQQ